MTPNDRVPALLETLIVEVRLMRQAIERQGRNVTASRDDVHLLATLLPATVTALKDRPFLIADLKAAPALAGFINAISARQLGRLFSRSEGLDIDGLSVERVGSEGHATVWRVRPGVRGVSRH